MQTLEHGFGSLNLVASDDAVRLAQRSHHCEGGVVKLRLNRREPLAQRLLRDPAGHEPEHRADDEAAEAAEEQTDQSEENGAWHGGQEANGIARIPGLRHDFMSADASPAWNERRGAPSSYRSD